MGYEVVQVGQGKYYSKLPLTWVHICESGALFLETVLDSFVDYDIRKKHALCSFVFQIPYFEFEKLRTLEEQVQYLHNKIFPIIFKFSHKS